ADHSRGLPAELGIEVIPEQPRRLSRRIRPVRRLPLVMPWLSIGALFLTRAVGGAEEAEDGDCLVARVVIANAARQDPQPERRMRIGPDVGFVGSATGQQQ